MVVFADQLRVLGEERNACAQEDTHSETLAFNEIEDVVVLPNIV